MRFAHYVFPCVLMALSPLMGSPSAAQSDDVAKSDVPMNEYAPKVPEGPAPLRVLTCHVRHATNIDPTLNQAESDIIYSDEADFTLELGAGRVPLAVGIGTARSDETPPVSYRIAADPQHLFAMAGPTLDRVADYWPKHVEVGKTIMGKAFSFILLDEVPGDPAHMTAFVSRAADAVAIDLGWTYRGLCKTSLRPR
ncbi:hypothetical protein [Sphingobium sp. CAP-1]|uniref:hypothetical protein n=1 Tax=Sphingobium sp. CAP-1 TaxID=2676077 RepID=UPI0012BB3C98|nr:hypothetical protein [Sphingobium sp. CAP-1]QGP80482.1 hypothetical protein GL174_15215 [Sphingobium sp. CAP-1]